MSHRIIDTHCDTLIRVLDEGIDLSREQPDGHLDLPRLARGGVGCQVFACFVTRAEHGRHVTRRALDMLGAGAALERLPGVLIPRSRAQLAGLQDSPRQVGVLLAVEGGDSLDGDLSVLDTFKELGVCYLTMAWNDNELCGSSFGRNFGLTSLGREVVRRMNQLSMLVDVSHMADAAFDDLARLTDAPFIASHSNCRELCSSPRNLTDRQIREIAARGGAVGVLMAPGFLSEQYRQAEAPVIARHAQKAGGHPRRLRLAMERARQEMAHVPLPTAEAILRHLEHLAEVGGIGCAALGSDFDGIPILPSGIQDCSDYQGIPQMLAHRGWSPREIHAVCWGNWERVLGSTFQE